MSSDLEQRLEEARAILAERPDGHLPLPIRRRVRAAWGFGDEGRRRRYALERLAAEHVLPRWDAERPGDRRPHEMLELADAVVEGRADGDAAADRAVELADQLDELIDEGVEAAAVYAALAAVAVQASARWGEEPEQLEDRDDDEDRDSATWESAFFASLADAPSLPKVGVAEHVEPRRAFWRWYLDKAVRAADCQDVA